MAFLTRTGMYVYPPVTQPSIVSYVHGYEAGIGCSDFTELLSHIVTSRYRIRRSNPGWPGQFIGLAQRYDWTWEGAFRRVSLQVLAQFTTGGLNAEMQHSLRSRILNVLERMENPEKNPRYPAQPEQLRELCPMRSAWFRACWSQEEWKRLRKYCE